MLKRVFTTIVLAAGLACCRKATTEFNEITSMTFRPGFSTSPSAIYNSYPSPARMDIKTEIKGVARDGKDDEVRDYNFTCADMTKLTDHAIVMRTVKKFTGINPDEHPLYKMSDDQKRTIAAAQRSVLETRVACSLYVENAFRKQDILNGPDNNPPAYDPLVYKAY